MLRALVPVLLLAAVGCGRVHFGLFDGEDVDARGDTVLATDALGEDPALLAYWPLDEAAGATVFVDVSPYANNGDCQLCPVAGVTGKRGTAVEFSATQDAGIHITSSAVLASWAGPLTIAAWTRIDANDMYGVLLSNDRDCCGNWDGYSLFASHYASGPALVTWAQGAEALARGTPLTLGIWIHIVGTFDSTQNRIYVDGVQADVANSTGFRSPFSFDTWIGALGYAAPDYHLSGAIDELMIFKRALSAAEVAALFASY